jgi:potassium-dependent mechanosensitive channel
MMLACVASAPAQQPQSSSSGAIPASPAAAPVGASLPASEAQPPLSTRAARLDAIAAMLDAIAAAIRNASSENALADLRTRLSPLRDQLRDLTAELEPRAQQIEQRLEQLGVPPANGGEVAELASERARLAADRDATESALKQATLLADRAGDLERRINDSRRKFFVEQLLTRTASPLGLAFWSDHAAAGAAEWRALAEFASEWQSGTRRNGDPVTALAAAALGAALLAALGGAVWAALRWQRRLVARPAPGRFGRAVAAVLIVLAAMATWPALILAAILVLGNFGLMPAPAGDIGIGLAAAAAAAGFGRGVAVSLFAPGDPGRRLIVLSDREAASYASHFAWAARAFGLAMFLNAMHRAMDAPAAPAIATGALFAFLVLGITVHLLWRSARADFRDAVAGPANAGVAWMRGVSWLFAVALALALAAGYVGLAMFIAGYVVASLAIVGATIIAVVFIDALLTGALAPDTPAGRRIAVLLGLAPPGLDIVETLASALLRLVVIILAAMLLLGYSGIFTENVFSIFGRGGADFTVGGITLSPRAVVAASALMAAGALAIRGAQRWLTTIFLPRTGLDAGLQNSILSLFGYAGAIVVFALALGALGIDLQKIALIAGALSVGIGFGLQSVVSNFVCGLILLAERPIRVGDWVVVKNEEGWVRRISVRATEIETFDRASVIIPNQDFITGVVKNWTRGNTAGRIIIKMRVTYDSNPDEVREVLMACGKAHPLVQQTPPPVVYLTGFADIGVDFELRCLIGDVRQALSIRSDLQSDMLRRFGEAAIKIPFPGHEERVPGPQAVVPPAQDAPPRPPAA